MSPRILRTKSPDLPVQSDQPTQDPTPAQNDSPSKLISGRQNSKERLLSDLKLPQSPTRARSSAAAPLRSAASLPQVKILDATVSSPQANAGKVVALTDKLRDVLQSLPISEAAQPKRFLSNTLALCKDPAQQTFLLSRLNASIGANQKNMPE